MLAVVCSEKNRKRSRTRPWVFTKKGIRAVCPSHRRTDSSRQQASSSWPLSAAREHCVLVLVSVKTHRKRRSRCQIRWKMQKSLTWLSWKIGVLGNPGHSVGYITLQECLSFTTFVIGPDFATWSAATQFSQYLAKWTELSFYLIEEDQSDFLRLPIGAEGDICQMSPPSGAQQQLQHREQWFSKLSASH